MPYRNREDQDAYYARWRKANPEKVREQNRRYRAKHSEKKAALNARRIFAGKDYIGSVGFTEAETKEMTHGKTE